MKRNVILLFALATLIASFLACALGTQVPAPKIDHASPESETAAPTQPEAVPTAPEPGTAAPTQPEVAPTAPVSGIPTSLVCHEKPGQDLAFRRWRNSESSQRLVWVGRVGPPAGSKDVWISTYSGLARLNLETRQCDLYTQAAGVLLAGDGWKGILPDGKGGFWVRRGQHLLHFSDEEWQVAYHGSSYIMSMRLTQTRDLCLGMMRPELHRFDWGLPIPKLCLESSEFPTHTLTTIEECHGVGCPAASTPGNCKDVQIALSPDGSETWRATTDSSCNHSLLYQTDSISHLEELPYDYVHGLASDHIHGGAWLGADSGLVYVDVKVVGTDAVSFTFHPVSVSARMPSLDAGRFPGEARGLAVDTSDLVWAVNGKSVLLYKEAADSWQEAASPMVGADVVAADPVRGAWAAGQGELVHLDGTHQQAWPMPDTLTGAPTALQVDESGRVWMGTTENGVWTTVPSPTLEGNTLDWRVLTAEDGLESASITALVQGPDGCMYAAHHAGVSAFCPVEGIEGGRWRTLPGSDWTSNWHPPGWVNALAFDQSGKLWAGTYPYDTLKRYDGKWLDFRPKRPEDLPSGSTFSFFGALMVDDENALWAGIHATRGGGKVYRWPISEEVIEEDGEAVWQAPDPGEMVTSGVFALAQDSHGRVWIGGRKGVAVWEGE